MDSIPRRVLLLLIILIFLINIPKNYAKAPDNIDTDILYIIQNSSVRATTPSFSLYFAPLATFIGEEDISIVQEVIFCESGFDQSAIGKAGEIGIAQFMPKTWDWFNKIRGTNLDINNIEDQLNMIFWAFNESYENHWTCWRELTKGR